MFRLQLILSDVENVKRSFVSFAYFHALLNCMQTVLQKESCRWPWPRDHSSKLQKSVTSLYLAINQIIKGDHCVGLRVCISWFMRYSLFHSIFRFSTQGQRRKSILATFTSPWKISLNSKIHGLNLNLASFVFVVNITEIYVP